LALLVAASAAVGLHWLRERRVVEADAVRVDVLLDPAAPQTAVRLEDGGTDVEAPVISVRKALEGVMTAWVEGLVAGDFSSFHRLISPSWQAKDDPARLWESYRVLAPYRDDLQFFPTRGKLTLLESRPLSAAPAASATVRDSLGPESPWLVAGEWRVGKTALGFTLVMSFEGDQWRPLRLVLEIYV
jgi:hypothetical protein